MQRTYWWPTAMPDQVTLVTNFQVKLPSHSAALELSLTQQELSDDLCNAIISSINICTQARTKMKSMTQWRDIVLHGDPEGSAAPAVPVFPVFVTPAYTRGVVAQFIDFRDMIVALPGYTPDIGADLGIIGAESTKKPANETQPVFKSVASSGRNVTLSGSMQGFGAMQVEYAKKGEDFGPVALVTHLPATFAIDPLAINPETGMLRAYFINKNVKYGNDSADYKVVLT